MTFTDWAKGVRKSIGKKPNRNYYMQKYGWQGDIVYRLDNIKYLKKKSEVEKYILDTKLASDYSAKLSR